MKAEILLLLSLAGMLLFQAESAQAAECTSPGTCFFSAIDASQTLTVYYGKNKSRGTMRCVRNDCKMLSVRPQHGLGAGKEKLGPRYRKFGYVGQGLYYRGDDKTEIEIEGGFGRLPENFAWRIDENWANSGLLSVDFTVAVNFLAVRGSEAHTLFELHHNEGRSSTPIVGETDSIRVIWDGVTGQLVLVTRQSFDGKKPLYSYDIPWDTTAKVINQGTPRFKTDTRKEEDSGPRLVSLYFRFHADGKVRIDMATINRFGKEILVSQVQDSGLRVKDYPSIQDYTPVIDNNGKTSWNWVSATYPVIRTLVTGDILTQATVFKRLLTDNEVMGFHSQNMYYSIKTPGDPWIYQNWYEAQPCNTGNWMNLNANYGGALWTVCGPLYGVKRW